MFFISRSCSLLLCDSSEVTPGEDLVLLIPTSELSLSWHVLSHLLLREVLLISSAEKKKDYSLTFK